MKQKILVSAVTKYQSVDEKTGQVTQGCTIEYIPEDPSLEEQDTYSKVGFFSFKANIDSQMGSILTSIPCICEANLIMKSTSKDRQPRLCISALNYLNDYQFDFRGGKK